MTHSMSDTVLHRVNATMVYQNDSLGGEVGWNFSDKERLSRLDPEDGSWGVVIVLKLLDFS